MFSSFKQSNYGFSKQKPRQNAQDDLQQPRDRSGNWQRVPFKARRRCFICDKEGHFQNSCPKKRINELHCSGVSSAKSEFTSDGLFDSDNSVGELTAIKSIPTNRKKSKWEEKIKKEQNVTYPEDVLAAEKFVTDFFQVLQ